MRLQQEKDRLQARRQQLAPDISGGVRCLPRCQDKAGYCLPTSATWLWPPPPSSPHLLLLLLTPPPPPPPPPLWVVPISVKKALLGLIPTRRRTQGSSPQRRPGQPPPPDGTLSSFVRSLCAFSLRCMENEKRCVGTFCSPEAPSVVASRACRTPMPETRDPYRGSDFRSVKCDDWKLGAPGHQALNFDPYLSGLSSLSDPPPETEVRYERLTGKDAERKLKLANLLFKSLLTTYKLSETRLATLYANKCVSGEKTHKHATLKSLVTMTDTSNMSRFGQIIPLRETRNLGVSEAKAGSDPITDSLILVWLPFCSVSPGIVLIPVLHNRAMWPFSKRGPPMCLFRDPGPNTETSPSISGHIIRKDFYSFPMLSRGSRSEAQQRGSMVEAAQGDSSPFGEGGLVGSRSLRTFSSQGPVAETAVRGARGQEVEGRRRGSAFFVEGCIVTTHHLSLPR
ncbi:hypothetical protein L3Q82_001331 [Scortum barcoo]|uniref:Uncharacterized protein n=1 Tax=Scortum barcoo TaxID=214431 RepID=A0ACB8W7S2_9TELE|nr:hypothetical protein L3Q82_001331 [Scortum barcoo]